MQRSIRCSVQVDETDAGKLPTLCHHRFGISAPALALATSPAQMQLFEQTIMILFCQQAVIFGRYTQFELPHVHFFIFYLFLISQGTP